MFDAKSYVARSSSENSRPDRVLVDQNYGRRFRRLGFNVSRFFSTLKYQTLLRIGSNEAYLLQLSATRLVDYFSTMINQPKSFAGCFPNGIRAVRCIKLCNNIWVPQGGEMDVLLFPKSFKGLPATEEDGPVILRSQLPEVDTILYISKKDFEEFS